MLLTFTQTVYVIGHGAWDIRQDDGTRISYPNVTVTTGEGEPDTVSVQKDAALDVASLPLMQQASLRFALTKRGSKRRLQVLGVDDA